MSLAQGGPRSAMEMDQLPTYDPQSETAKKEALRARFAENMVHVIPLVIVFCALVLWFFSYPGIFPLFPASWKKADSLIILSLGCLMECLVLLILVFLF